jgi:hypothetical protein
MIIKNVLFDDIRPLHHIARNVLACYVQIRVCLQVVLTLAEEKFCVKKVIFACENLVVRKTCLIFASLSGLKIKPLRF